MTERKTLRRQRLQEAMTQLPALQSELAFERIDVVLSDEGRHWQFFYGSRYLASYWPASARGQTAGHPHSVPCGSVSRAKRVAVGAKNHIFSEMAAAMLSDKAPDSLLASATLPG
jgi:hypothetical protein